MIRSPDAKRFAVFSGFDVEESFYPSLADEAWESEVGPSKARTSSTPTALKPVALDPPGHTIYAKISLGEDRNRQGRSFKLNPLTGIFIPENFSFTSKADLVLYLHGHTTAMGSVAGIDEYWNAKRFPYFALREGVNQSGKNFILVAPTLGPRSESGNLKRPGGFDKYLNQVLSELNEKFVVQRFNKRVSTIGSIILACHSGGGLPMRRLALSNEGYARRIRECWGFDCLYNTGDGTLWAQWARSNPDKKLFIYYLGSTQRHSQLLSAKHVPNVMVARSTAKAKGNKSAHYWVPIEHWLERLQAAPMPATTATGADASVGGRQEVETSVATPNLGELRANIVRIADQEWTRWNAGGKKFERDPKIRKILQDYWLTGAGRRYTASDLGSQQFQSRHPWSAAFISWVMRQAGAGSAFKYAAAHAAYVKAAKDNRIANNSNPFKAYRITEVRPEPGDLVCKTRAGSGATYDNVKIGLKTHCDIVTEVRPGKLTTIGGNVSQSVSKTPVSINGDGYINNPGYFAVVKLVPPGSSYDAPGQLGARYSTVNLGSGPARTPDTSIDFVPVPLENPGGRRIEDKRDPVPSDLVTITGVGGKRVQLHRLAADAWRAMVRATRIDGIRSPLLLPNSGYRSSAYQAGLWQNALKKYGSSSEANRWVARPGGSAHQSGRAIDLYLGGTNDSRNVANLRRTPAYQWLVRNARRFGFYPYEREPWHWEYNPPAR